ncbi:MAG: DUF1476 domain-containing protein [Caulobacteraceae bacterium]
MTTFDDREHAFEAHFALEGEVEFLIQARRDRLIGVWAGEQLGLSGDDLEAYVLSLMHTDLAEHSRHDVYQKVLADFGDKGVKIMPQDLREKMEELLAKARIDVQAKA